MNTDAAQSIAGDPPSVVILTFNEEPNIASCLESCSRLSDDLVVLDSGSTDRTVDIARKFPNVRVFHRPFDTEYKQRNYGVREIEYRHPWLYICDADERLPQPLIQEIIQKTSDPANPFVAYRTRYRNIFRGKWIKHASSYPSWIIRLVRPGSVTYEVRETNIHPVVDGPIGELQEHFEHYSFNSGLVRWFSKHNYYSSREAQEGAKVRRQGLPPVSALLNRDPMKRRRALKNVSYFLKGRGVWRFLHSYFLSGGWLDGSAGFHYCAMVAMYEYWIDLKMREFERPWTQKNEAATQRLLLEVNA
ncbi:MAG TPA: glycosyltransferase family 2 protein [Humisphaera sp.]|jgi:glycosyltransferase involved in cell wall biosynthesis|nr:glycosyltransferase family 2 protein [Humisphaera sp.]